MDSRPSCPPAHYDAIAHGDRLSVKEVHSGISQGRLVLMDETQNRDIPLVVELSDREKRTLLAGGLINATRRGA